MVSDLYESTQSEMMMDWRNDSASTVFPPDIISRTDPNISTFHGNATAGTQHDESPGRDGVAMIIAALS
jgi:hypothetical protein